MVNNSDFHANHHGPTPQPSCWPPWYWSSRAGRETAEELSNGVEIRNVRTRNRCQAAIDRAFWGAAASTALGLLGPINPPAVLIPPDGQRPSRPAPPSPVRRVKSAHRPKVQTA